MVFLKDAQTNRMETGIGRFPLYQLRLVIGRLMMHQPATCTGVKNKLLFF